MGVVADGAALVSEAHRLRPDVIVADITMPILDGIEAVRKVRLSGSTAVVVFLSVHRGSEFIEACIEAGALGYVEKLCMADHLIPAIEAALAGRYYISPSDLAP